MAISKFPKGFTQGVEIKNVPILNTHGGEVYWVDSNSWLGSDSGPGSQEKAWAYCSCLKTNDSCSLLIKGDNNAFKDTKWKQ